jgi:vacuolar-type H+-ATPase subunit E/Vma4
MIDPLLARLERDADAEAAQILEDGRARAAAISGASDARIAERRAATVQRRETAARVQHERALARSRRMARARVLEARATLLDRLFEQVRATLPAVAASSAYRATLRTRLERLRAYTGGQPITIQCMPSLAGALRRLAKTNGHLRITPDRQIAAGFRVLCGDGGVEIDARLESRLERLRPRLALDALAELAI